MTDAWDMRLNEGLSFVFLNLVDSAYFVCLSFLFVSLKVNISDIFDSQNLFSFVKQHFKLKYDISISAFVKSRNKMYFLFIYWRKVFWGLAIEWMMQSRRYEKPVLLIFKKVLTFYLVCKGLVTLTNLFRLNVYLMLEGSIIKQKSCY